MVIYDKEQKKLIIPENVDKAYGMSYAEGYEAGKAQAKADYGIEE